MQGQTAATPPDHFGACINIDLIEEASHVASLCLIPAPRFRDQKWSCTTHISRLWPPGVSGGCARSLSWCRLETMLCPYTVPVNAAGSACMPSREFQARGRGSTGN